MNLDKLGQIKISQTQAQAMQAIVQSPFPELWPEILTKRSSLYRSLPEKLKPKLHKLISLFLHKIDFAPLEGEEPPVEITEQMRVLVAAEACLLILNLRDDPIECFSLYQKVKEVRIARNIPKTRVEGAGDILVYCAGKSERDGSEGTVSGEPAKPGEPKRP